MDFGELLAEDRKIAHVWGIADVQSVRPDLDDERGVGRAAERATTTSTRSAASPGTPSSTPPMSCIPTSPSATGRAGSTSASRTPTATARTKCSTGLRDMAELLARDMPDVKADVDPGSVRLLDSDETTGKQGRRP